MSWLCRLSIDTEIIHNEKIWDNYAWHQRIWQDCFPYEPDAKRDFLTRIDPLENSCRVWILAQRSPVRPSWCPQGGFEIKEISPSFLSHRYYAFDLKANPVRTKVQRGPNGETLYKPNGKRKTGKRVPLIKEDELKAWLIGKGEKRCHDKGLM
ncbi:MAG: type I-E CRISPR-associated protein Cas6/Cse3/CasE [Desulfobacteraceae bacterium]|nr:type I-E CRISPR-associated protein Cas6/Cse3/CasE [Desulfobacteraceae bacterium]MBU4053672.1 type I-E CRISPR-associated protein Cas6/Cse3/CasE [Pseudomonadota bacterium]